MVFDDKYQFLLQHYTAETIGNRYAAWLGEMQKIVNFLGGGDYFTINGTSLSLAVLDYFTDIVRLKQFQDIERANVQKIYAYGTYWLLRRNPVQAIAPFPPELSFINERTMLLMLLPKILAEVGADYKALGAESKQAMLSFASLLFYNFRFRSFTPQTLELMNEAFIAGFKLGKNRG
jgi:hypothetical protein